MQNISITEQCRNILLRALSMLTECGRNILRLYVVLVLNIPQYIHDINFVAKNHMPQHDS